MINPIKINDFCNFSIGNAWKCDTVINKVFYNSGYKIFNWAQKYKTIHVDL